MYWNEFIKNCLLFFAEQREKNVCMPSQDHLRKQKFLSVLFEKQPLMEIIPYYVYDDTSGANSQAV